MNVKSYLTAYRPSSVTAPACVVHGPADFGQMITVDSSEGKVYLETPKIIQTRKITPSIIRSRYDIHITWRYYLR
jgi:hypothetical protein